MRILHIADLHLGQVYLGYSRLAEQEVVLGQILDLLERHEVDALLVAGDVFHSANPPVAALNLWYRFLVQAHRRRPRLETVAVAGNHDAAGRFEVVEPFARQLGVHLLGSLPRHPDSGELDAARLLVPLHDATGQRRAVCVAVPFLRSPDLRGDPTTPGWQRRAAEHVYADAFALARQHAADGEAILGMGHLPVDGTPLAVAEAEAEAERRTALDGEFAPRAAELFPEDAAYVALGHIHAPQAVGGRETVRYAGSPLPLSMAEVGYAHQAVLVELDAAGQVAECRACRLAPPVAMQRIPALAPGRTAVEVAEAVRDLQRLPAADEAYGAPPEEWPYVAVHLLPTEPNERLRQRVEQAAAGKAARLVQVRIARPSPAEQAAAAHAANGHNHASASASANGHAAASAEPAVEPQTLASLDPERVFALRYAEAHDGDTAVPAALLAYVRDLVEAVAAEDPGEQEV